MTILEFYLEAIRKDAHLRSEWVTRMFCVSNLPTELVSEPYPYQLYDVEGVYHYHLDGELHSLGAKTDKPLLHKDLPVNLKPGDLLNVTKEVITTVGNVLANAIMFIYPFGNKIEFLLGQFNLGKIEAGIVARLEDDLEEGMEPDPEKLYVNELIRFIDATTSLVAFNTLFVPGLTERALGPCPAALKRMDQLLKVHAHELDNPVVVAGIQKEIQALDREYIQSDPDAGFYYKDKSFAVVRMKMYYMYGIEKNFTGDGTYTFVENSLIKGWDYSKLPEMCNTARDGSFKRGAETALGGEKVKIAFRALSGIIVSEEDCGSTVGEPVNITTDNRQDFIGNTFIVGGKSVLIDDANSSNYIGQRVIVRSPLACHTKDGNYCLTCMGMFMKGRENTVAARVADIPSTMMSQSMAAMHGKQLKSVKVDLNRAFS